MSYFTDNKKGEVNELRNLLRNIEIQRDPTRYRIVVQKVIAFMTQGIDVSRLFSEMIMASATSDIVQKKLCYLYICSYAESHSNLALLTVNTMQTDTRHPNPLIRGLALRTMCSLRLSNLVEYVQEPLLTCLEDRSAYVRKAAVLGCVKLFYVNEELISDLNIIDRLYRMLRDPDQQVVVNCVVALNEMLASEGGIALNRSIAHHLLNMMKNFNEWGQSLVMQLMERYRPSDEEEVFDLLNILDERLKHANSGVVLAAINLFIKLTADLHEIHEDVFGRIRAPLVSILRSGTSELVYTCLHHAQLLLLRQPHFLENDYKTFFCRFNDPAYVKHKRLELLTEIATPGNAHSIIDEISAYATDVGVEMARRSVRALGKISMRLDAVSDYCMGKLLSLFSLEMDYVTSETLVVMQELVRKYTWMAEGVLLQLPASMDIVTDVDGRAAMVWFLGEHGQHLPDAPYLLEHMINNVAEEESSLVRLQLLTATMKLFFKRPPECQLMLGKLLEYAVDEDTHMDVRDRGLLYYRLLKKDVREAERVVCTAKQPVELFTEDQTAETKDRLLAHLNSLASIYQKMPSLFVSGNPPYTLGSVPTGQEGPNLSELPPVQLSTPVASISATSPPTADAAPAQPASDFLISVDDSPGPGQEIGAVGPAGLLTGDLLPILRDPKAAIDLNPAFRLMPKVFQEHWFSLPEGESERYDLLVVPLPSELEQTMLSSNIITMASSPPGQEVTKCFFYAQQTSTEVLFFIEASIHNNQSLMTAVFKCNDASTLTLFREHFRKSLVGKWMAMDS